MRLIAPNITITSLPSNYETHRIAGVIAMHSPDIILANFGLHYNAEKQYDEFLKKFVGDVETLKRQRGLPHIFFLETTPQHFDSESGSYHSSFAR